MNKKSLAETAPASRPQAPRPYAILTHREFSSVSHTRQAQQPPTIQPVTNDALPNTRIARCDKTAPRAPSSTSEARSGSFLNSSYSWRKPPACATSYNRSVHGDRRDLLCPRAQRRRRRSVVLEPACVWYSTVSSGRFLPLFL